MGITRVCSKCNLEKDITLFVKRKGRSEGYGYVCKECNRIDMRDYREKHRDKIREHQKKSTNKPEIKERRKQYEQDYYIKNKDKDSFKESRNKYKQSEKSKAYKKEYNKSEKGRKYKREYSKKLKSNNPDYKLSSRMRSNIYRILRGERKGASTLELLGCTIQEFRIHIESLFQDGMTWENHGTFGWHIDHILPCASFDLSDPSQQKECFNYINLQPLWAEDNLKKGAKLVA